MANDDKLQIYAVEERSDESAVCVVRCIGGRVRLGQVFSFDTVHTDPCETLQVSLDWIELYGKQVEFIDPPYSARVRLHGEGVSELRRGATIHSVGQ